MDGEFCIEALEEALLKFGRPEIFNTDSKNDGVGGSRQSGSIRRRVAEDNRRSEVSQSP
jgi:hypothetical protein